MEAQTLLFLRQRRSKPFCGKSPIRSGVPSEKFISSSVLAEKICAIGLIDDWEKEAIKLFFAKVRNPLSHGVAEGPIPTLSDAQTNWAIRYCMITILRLIS